MTKNKHKHQTEVTLEDGSVREIYVKQPTNDDIKDADIHKAKIWNKAFKEGVLTKKEVQAMMKDRGIWDEKKQEEEKITKEILTLEKKLYMGSGGKKPKVSEGRQIALDMIEKRNELRELISERMSLDENTAESIADNARFDFLVSCCVFYCDTDECVFEGYEDYNNRGSSQIAVAGAGLLAAMMYNLDADFENNLPERMFLKQYELIDEEGYLVDPNDKKIRVDSEGRRINDLGHFVDEKGNRVDADGNPLDEEGNYTLIDYENDLVTSKKKVVKKTPRKRATKKTATQK